MQGGQAYLIYNPTGADPAFCKKLLELKLKDKAPNIFTKMTAEVTLYVKNGLYFKSGEFPYQAWNVHHS